MVRSFWVGTLVAILVCTAPSWGQGMQPHSFVSVKGEGGVEVKCKVLKCWTDKDGSRVCQVQEVNTGEMMTLIDEPSSPGKTKAFAWGSSKLSPAGLPVPPNDAQVVSSWTPPARGGLLGKMFSSDKPAPSGPVIHVQSKAETAVATAPVDMRESWGKVDHTPVKKVEPIQTKVVRVNSKVSGDPHVHRIMPMAEEPVEMPAVSERKSATVVTSAPTENCANCTPETGGKGGARLFGRLTGRRGAETDDAGMHEQPKEKVLSVKVEEVKPESYHAKPTHARREAHVGIFANLLPKHQESAPLPRSNLPAGMSSVNGATMAGPVMPSVPVTGNNAFMASSGYSMALASSINPGYGTLGNAFTNSLPSRMVPADAMLPRQAPNAQLQMQGMGGAQARPPMQMAYGYGHPMHGYYAPAMMPSNGVGVASDINPATTPYLVALRHSVMPSERERAVEVLAQVNWKADPQVVPALVMAAQTDPATSVRLSCLRALGQMQANSEPTIEALTALKEDKDYQVRNEAQRVLPALMKK